MIGKRALLFLFSLSVFLSCTSSGWAERLSRVRLLHFNDIYEITPQKELGGFAPLLTLIEQQRQQAVPSLLTFGGDLLSPSVLSYLTKGKEMITLCNIMGVDVAVLGNHEFDHGLETLHFRLGESRFPWLASNLRAADGGLLPHSQEWVIRQVGDLQIAFIGLLTPATADLATLGSQVRFLDPIPVAKELLPLLKQQGVDLIIALTHLSLAEDEELARQVEGIDLILGGHDHDNMLRTIGNTHIVKAASDGAQLARIDLTLLRPDPGAKGKSRVLPEFHFLSTFRLPAHPEVQTVIEGIHQRLQQQLQRSAGVTEGELDSRESTVRERESSLANLFADAMRLESGADVTLLNGGSLRGNRLYAPGTVLSLGDIYKESPFGNTVVVMEMSEQAIWQALEHGLSQLGKGSGRFLQLSGLSIRYDPRQAVGERVLDVELWQGERSEPLRRDGTRLLKVASNDYLARGGDGFRMLAESRVLIAAEAGQPLSTVVMNYLQKQGQSLVLPRAGRIQVVGP